MYKYEKAKKEAVKFRKKGYSYSQILKEIPVAKSTLSLWLKNVKLAKWQKQRLSQKKLQAAKRGAEKRKNQRIETTKSIKEKAIKEIKKISKKELWLMGIMLYWAEGAKEREKRPSTRLEFNNSDPWMIKLFLKWLLEILRVSPKDLIFEIYIHRSYKNKEQKIIKYWKDIINLKKRYTIRVYFKNHKTKRKRIRDDYCGNLKIKVRHSSFLNRKISGWIDGINNYYWGVV